MSTLPSRLLALIHRELGASDVRVVGPVTDASEPANESALRIALPRGYTLLVDFADMSFDRAGLEARLEALVEAFHESLMESLEDLPRPLAADLLQKELRDIAAASGAIDAVVIDATSKVTWGAADAEDTAPQMETPLAEVIALDPAVRRSTPAPPLAPKTTSELCIDAVRALPAIQTLSRGGSLAHHESEGDARYVARSFATIYVLILVFDSPIDELRAERALQAQLESIERLVLALPPLDPTPLAGAKAMRSRR